MDARKVLQEGTMPLAILGQGELSTVIWPEDATFLSALTGSPGSPHLPSLPVCPSPPAPPVPPQFDRKPRD
jgi:hypothetical protein